ncbi:ComEC/Rec2 family competence protein [Mycetocola miduiensis]|uniref:Competence protein ComEC n=1 Tax=Mycetocola miduiensis TaxID=995034 RepID=A0A1I5CTN7_9MICO|nr:ComEC/Rec2 family competence protein [Mycetocola miduiensis]SFN90308.1 competence protein ComEC [Mycetocola miduiensis]
MNPAHRLVFPAAAAWITAVIVVGFPDAAWAVSIAGFAMMAAAGIVAVTRPRQRGESPCGRSAWWAMLTVTLLAVSLAATAVAAREGARSPEILLAAADAGRTVTVRVTVTEKSVVDASRGGSVWDRSTQQPTAGGSGASDDETAQRIHATVTEVELGAARVSVSVPIVLFITVTKRHPVPIGSVLEAEAVPRATEQGDDAAFLLFAGRPAAILEGPPWYLAWAGDMRKGLVGLAENLPGGGGELLPGLSTGDTTAVSDELDQSMKASSLSHLTAVSGANCAVIVAVLTALLAALRAPRWLRISGALVGLGLFVILVTPEPSVIRAALMALAVLLALGAGRPSAGLPVLSLVVIMVVIGDPWLSRTYGFVLSALATGGLLILTRPITRMLAAWMPHWLAAAFALPLAAQLACQPVLILLAPTIPVLGVPANLLAAPAAPIATLLGLAACILAPVLPPVAVVLAWLGWLPAAWIAAIATTVNGLPVNRLPWLPDAEGALLLAALTTVLILGVRSALIGRRVIAGLCTGVLVLSGGAYAGSLAGPRIGQAMSMPSDWTSAACDVGQGDAILVRDGGAVALLDTGPDPVLLTTCLDAMSIGRLDLLVLTHFDLDHVGGVSAVIGRVNLALVAEPVNPSDARILADLAAGGASIRRATAGLSGTLGASRWGVLWPPPRAGPLWTGNSGSVTLLFESPAGARSLFLGDLDERAQERIVAGHAIGGPVDLVKMAHHGSADQSERMYTVAAARVALIPVGADNRYGHPTPAALELLTAAGKAAFRTDTCGMIVVGALETEPVVWTARPC